MANITSINAFMRPELKEDIIVEIPGIKTFSDEDGNPIPMKVRALTTSDLEIIRKSCRKRKIAKDTRGKPIFQSGVVQYSEEYDNNAMSNEMIAAALVFPDLHDQALRDYYGVNSAAELVPKMFRKVDDYQYIVNQIQEISGITDDADEMIDEAKN